jgi:S-adenosylmethionine:tRNA ribosyltransferase-isomerase
MKLDALRFDRPPELQASLPPEMRGVDRDGVRLLVSSQEGHAHRRFRDLPDLLSPGDLLVVNESGAMPASLQAHGRLGDFILNLSTNYGRGLWLAEARWSQAKQGPLPLVEGEAFEAAGLPVRLVSTYPGLPRLAFVHIEGDVFSTMALLGRPIRYGYVNQDLPLSAYQTAFSRVPGSAEMPSAARPFTQRVIEAIAGRGVGIAKILLHTGVSSLEIESEAIENQPLYPEPFEVPSETAAAVNAARARGSRVVAVGTTVVRALESAHDGKKIRPSRGFTRLYVNPYRPVRAVDGILTGFHDPVTTHLAMMYAVAGETRVRAAYSTAIAEGYHWHEFGDSHLLWGPAAWA